MSLVITNSIMGFNKYREYMVCDGKADGQMYLYYVYVDLHVITSCSSI